MKKYRMAYDRVFLPGIANGALMFEYNGESIGDVSICFEYQVFDEAGNEVFFTCADDEEMTEQYLDGTYPLSSFYKCCFDRESEFGYSMTPSSISDKTKFSVKYKVLECFKTPHISGYPIQISHEEFCRILLDNADQFDSSDNKPTQTCAYVTVEVTD